MRASLSATVAEAGWWRVAGLGGCSSGLGGGGPSKKSAGLFGLLGPSGPGAGLRLRLSPAGPGVGDWRDWLRLRSMPLDVSGY